MNISRRGRRASGRCRSTFDASCRCTISKVGRSSPWRFRGTRHAAA
jgi:hypothetical protein